MRTIVYIDALNLYYRSLRDTPYRWLDPVALADALLPNDQVVTVKYFTAQIKALPHDPAAPTRQQIYLRALRTIQRIDFRTDSLCAGRSSLRLRSERLEKTSEEESSYAPAFYNWFSREAGS